MNAETVLIDTLAHSSLFRQYQEAFTETTGLPLALRPVETWHMPLHGVRHENGWCSLMTEKSATCAACLQVQERLAQTAGDHPAALTCAYGLSEMVVPVLLGSHVVGYLQTGQVVNRKPTRASFERALNRTRELGVCFDESEARKAFFNTPVFSSKRLHFLQNLLLEFAEHLSLISNQLTIQQQHAELPTIARAKRHIEDHLSENLSLETVARHVNVSVFYFCKLFRKSTGLTFTEYLSRRRIERAKSLLLNRNLRISEIAFDSGFQSLTHFNRMFRKIVGQSPTDYRRHLPSN